MGGRRRLAVALLVAAGPAWGQSGFEAAVGPQLEAYTGCLSKNAHDLATTSSDDDKVISLAVVACQAERKNLWLAMQDKVGMSPNDATRQLDEMLEAIRPQMAETIKKSR